jgi:phage terminase large subunit GpA-like protein
MERRRIMKSYWCNCPRCGSFKLPGTKKVTRRDGRKVVSHSPADCAVIEEHQGHGGRVEEREGKR